MIKGICVINATSICASLSTENFRMLFFLDLNINMCPHLSSSKLNLVGILGLPELAVEMAAAEGGCVAAKGGGAFNDRLQRGALPH